MTYAYLNLALSIRASNTMLRDDNYLSVKEATALAKTAGLDHVVYSCAKDLAKGEYYVGYRQNPARMSKTARDVLAKAVRNEETNQVRETSRKRRQEALNSESVNMAIEVLDAEIVEIRPLGEKR